MKARSDRHNKLAWHFLIILEIMAMSVASTVSFAGEKRHLSEVRLATLREEEQDIVFLVGFLQEQAFTAEQIEHIPELPVTLFLRQNLFDILTTYDVSLDNLRSLMAYVRNGVSLPSNYKSPAKISEEENAKLSEKVGNLRDLIARNQAGLQIQSLNNGDELTRFVSEFKISGIAAIMDTIPNFVSVLANKDASFVFVPGINTKNRTRDDLYRMKTSLGTEKMVLIAHGSASDAALISMNTIKADKYILISPNFSTDTLSREIRNAGVSPDQIIVVQASRDIATQKNPYSASKINNNWTLVLIEDGPKTVTSSLFKNHNVPLDAWLNENTHKISINGNPTEKNSLSKVLQQSLN